VTAAIENSVPPLLGMAPDDFWGAIKQGHSLHELAVAHNISDSQMHDTALAAARAALAQGVEKGQWTQAQSDGLSPNLSTMVDKVLGALSPKRDGPSGAQAPPK
ncbi:MAG TPA: hypothetical protein VM536_11655, partial [Chloroflexia bacterium]|nr:hypothetical protein [Chloroflexia bacterium]